MIVVKNLYKDYGSLQALSNVNFCLQKGEVVCLLGENGAGKSTLMRILTGYLEPSLGEVSILGQPLENSRQEVLQKIGYMPENAPLYGEMSVFEYLEFMAQMHQVAAADFKPALQEVVAELRLEAVINQKTESLSKGYKSRVSIAGSLIHKPKILILDEPTAGLDPNQKLEVREIIKAYGQKNIVLVSTHIMEEVEALANRVLFLSHGKLIRDTTAENFMQFAAGKSLDEAFHAITMGI